MCFRWTVFQHDFIKMEYAWNIIVYFVLNRRYKLFMVNEVRQFTRVFNGRVSHVNSQSGSQ